MKKRKSITVGWIYSYMLVLFIPIITIFIVFSSNVRVVKEETIRVNELLLHSIQQDMDTYIKNMDMMYDEILINSSLRALRSNKISSNSFYENVLKATNSFTRLIDYETGVSYMIFIRDSNYILWDGVSNTSKIMYNAKEFTENNFLAYEEWMRIIEKKYKGEYFISPYLNYNNVGECFVYADTLAKRGAEYTNVFVFFPISKLDGITDLLGEKTVFQICCGNNTILSLGDELSDLHDYVKLTRSSETSDLQYRILISNEKFWEKCEHLKNILFISLLITVIIGGVCTALIINRNIKPITRLLEKLGGQKEHGNELQQIELIFDKLNDYVLTQREVAQHNFLLSLMKGKYYEVLPNNKSCITLHENESVFMVAFDIPIHNKRQTKQDDLLIFAVDNVFVELMNDYVMYHVEEGEYLYYILMIKKQHVEQIRNTCKERINYLLELFELKWEANISAAISGIETQLERICFLYQDVNDAFEYQKLVGSYGLIDVNKLEMTQKRSYSCNLGVSIEVALLNHDYNKLIQTADELFRLANKSPFVIFRMQVLEVFQTIAKLWDRQENTENQKIFLVGYLTPLLETTNEEMLRKVFNEMLIYVYNNMYNERNITGDVAKIREYIQMHFTDKELNVSTIAETIGMKARYLSRIFKEETQEGILDYLNMLRINKAKMLIDSGKYSLEEVGEMVGYTSHKTFHRIFLKNTGVTPGRYMNRDDMECKI